MLKDIKKLIDPQDYKRFIRTLYILVLDALFHAIIFSMLFLVLLDITRDSLTSNKLLIYTLVILAMMIIRFFILNSGYYAAQADGAKTIANLRIKMGDYIRNLNMGFFNKNNIGELTNTITNDLTDFETLITHLLADLMKYSVLTSYLVGCLFYLNPMIGCVQLVALLLALFLLKKGKANLSQVATRSKKIRSVMLSNIIEYVNGISLFKSYNLMGSQFKRLHQSLDYVKKESIQVQLTTIPYVVPVQIVLLATFPITAYLMAQQFFAGEVELKQIVLFLVISISFMNVSNSWAVLSLESAYYQISVKKLLGILNLPEIEHKTKEFSPNNYNIVFDKVEFSYVPEKKVLNQLDFSVSQGELVALIGESGSGKSTVLNLLARFWNPTEGKILIGGIDIKTIYPDTLLSKISMVFQDVYLLQDSIFENIRIGNPNASKEEVIQAAKLANCHEFILEQPQGYETVLSESGKGLSGGEKQRISIARAFLKDAPIVLLDEATASLDVDNEAIVQESIQQLVKNKTVLVIAHRLNTIRKASKIILLRDGKIAEAGSHDELLANKQSYYKMFQTMSSSAEWSL